MGCRCRDLIALAAPGSDDPWHLRGRNYADIGKRLNIAADTGETHWREAKTKPKLKDLADHKDLLHLIDEVLFEIRLDAALKRAMEKPNPAEAPEPPPEPSPNGGPLPESRMLPPSLGIAL